MKIDLRTATLCLLSLVLLLAAASCTGDGFSKSSPQPTSTALAGYQSRLSDTVWQKVQGASWYNDGALTPDGTRLLDVMIAAGPLWQDSDRLELLADYPDGIDESTSHVAGEYARMSLSNLYEIIREPWLTDGVDDYERAVIAAASQRVVSAAALRKTLQDGLFRASYEADPASLNPYIIDAVGSLDPRTLDYLETQDWFNDGIDTYEASLLAILNTIVSTDDQLALLKAGNYRRLDLTQSSIAVLFEGKSKDLMDRAFAITQAWMPRIEGFLGPYKPTALIVDVTPDPNITFCHTGGGNEFRPSAVALPLDGCFRAPIVIHELAHAFIGGRYPPWFSEGAAELVVYHLTGSRSGYFGGTGTIDLEGQFLLASTQYQNQAALGADFLETLYKLAGADQMSAFFKDVEGRSLTGQNLLDRIRQMNIDHTALEDLIASSFGPATASSSR
ncbi:MAG TPA: hypothetical protein VFX19_10900 [Dehalococcoidia bacterium]|nr:hypothetical protein [Dehalococcoidia bacterium]